MNTKITIQGTQKHITRYNIKRTFTNKKEALNYLLLMLDKLNYRYELTPELNDGDFYDTGDYFVSVELFEYTYDIIFHDDTTSNNKGFSIPLEDAHEYIRSYNGTNESYFANYKGGMVEIFCNETESVVYSTPVF